MAPETRNKKRKSVDGADASIKKVKTAKVSDKAAPLKSALKKSKVETTAATNGATKKVTAAAEKKSKTKTKEPSPEAEVELPTEDGEQAGAELTEDQTAALLAGFSSSEDEGSDGEEEGIALDKLPKPPKPSALQTTTTDGEKPKNPESTPGVVYVGRVPHGFFEHQMRAYFAQFGTITHLRLARNRKTGKSKHFAFIEFSSAAVAEIVAKTMDKYLLFNHILQVRVVPREQVPEGIWKGEGRRKAVPRNRIEGGKLKRGTDREGWERRISREEQRRAKKSQDLKDMGYEFDAPAVKSVDDVPVKQIEQGEAATEDETKLLEEEKKTEEAAPAPKAKAATKSKPAVVAEGKEDTKKRPAAKADKPKAKKAKK